MLKKPNSIKIEILTVVFTYITEYFNIPDELIQEKYKIGIIKNEKVKTTISKLRKLSNDLKIPVSTFFLSETPNFPEHQIEFRNVNLDKINFKTINAIRETLWFIDIYNTYKEDYGAKSLPNFTETTDPIIAGQQINQLIEFEKMRNYKNIDTVLRNIRKGVFEFGILVFQNNFPMNDTRGFTVKLQNINAITLNKNEDKPARIFTLLHELGHILLNKHGISNPSEIEPDNSTEIWCNKFAAAIIFPDQIMKKITINQTDIGSDINNLSEKLHSSKYALGVELVKRDVISRTQLNEFLERPYYKKSENNKSGGFSYKNKVYSEKGSKFTQVVMNAYHAKKLTQIEVSEILGIRHTTFDSLLAVH